MQRQKKRQSKKKYNKKKQQKIIENEETFEIEKIIAKRKNGRKNEYLISWKGYSENDNTWETGIDLKKDGFGELIKKFDREQKKKKSPKRKVKSPKRKVKKKLTLKDIKKRLMSKENFLLIKKLAKKIKFHKIPAVFPGKGLPDSYLTDKLLLSPILDQQDCGSCAAFATTALITTNYLMTEMLKNTELHKNYYYLLALDNSVKSPVIAYREKLIEEWIKRKHKAFDKEIHGSIKKYKQFVSKMAKIMHKSLNLNWKARESVPLSPQMMLSCRKQPICSGYGINHYLEDLKTNKYGEFSFITSDKDLPYEYCENCSPEKCKKIRSSCIKKESKLLKKKHNQFRISNYREISENDSSKKLIDNIKQAIFKYGAVGASIPAYDSIFEDTQKSPFEYDASIEGKIIAGHAIIIVGWKNGFWRVQNSWGIDSNDQGFFWLKWGSLTYIIYAEVYVKKITPTLLECQNSPPCKDGFEEIWEKYNNKWKTCCYKKKYIKKDIPTWARNEDIPLENCDDLQQLFIPGKFLLNQEMMLIDMLNKKYGCYMYDLSKYEKMRVGKYKKPDYVIRSIMIKDKIPKRLIVDFFSIKS